MERHPENVQDAEITLLWLEDTGSCYADSASENSHRKSVLKSTTSTGKRCLM